MEILRSSENIVQKLFIFLNEKKVAYAVLGDTSRYPEMGTDVDLCIKSYKTLLFFMRDFCQSHDISLLNITRFSNGVRFDVATTSDDKDKIFHFVVDLIIFPTWRIKGDIGICFSELLKSRKMDSRGFFVPSPNFAFIFYLSKYVEKEEPKSCNWKYLSEEWSKDPKGIQQTLRMMWPQHSADLLIQAAETGFWSKVIAAFPKFRDELKKNSSWSMKRAIWNFKSFVSRVHFRVGLHVSILGPDGSGKSSVIDRIRPDLHPVFREITHIHLRPGIGTNKNDSVPVVDPHGEPPRSKITSMIKVLYLWFDYSVGWCLTVWPKTVRLSLVVFDRYYHDMLVDPLRYRYGGPMWLARWIGKLIPKPDMWILLDAPPAVLQGRKQEVSFEETARQREAYLKLVKGMKNSVIVDASQNLDEVVADVNSAILKFLAERTEKRYG